LIGLVKVQITEEFMIRAFQPLAMFLLVTLWPFSMGCSSDNSPEGHEVSSTELHLISSEPSIPFIEPDLSALCMVDRAYALAGMKRVRFDPTNPTIPAMHREYLAQCLALIDQAVVWRVSALQAIVNDSFLHEDWLESGDNLVTSLDSLYVPSGMERHRQLLTECILAYGRFLGRHAEGGSKTLGQDWQSDRDLRISSNASREAYDLLIKLHWQADAYVHNAYYNAHMALDPF
jgi:hypothetical protein